MPPRKPALKAATRSATGATRKEAKPAKTAKATKDAVKPAKDAKAAVKPAKAAAKKSKAPFEDYAFKQGLGMIGEGYPRVTIEQTATTATARFGTHVFASMVRDGADHVVIGVLVQADDRKGLATRGFVADPHPTGWFQVRLGPVPKAWFRADLTSLVLSTIAALRAAADVGRWKSLLSNGGPYVVLPKSRVARWGEDGEGTDADAATRAPDAGAVIEVAAGPALILGTPDRLYFQPLDNGGVFVRVVSFDADDDKLLAKHVAAVPESAWSPLGAKLVVDEDLWAFDATQDGVAIGTGNSLQCVVSRGTHAIETATFSPDDGTELLLVRLGAA